MKAIRLIGLVLMLSGIAHAQTSVSIEQIQGTGDTSVYNGKTIRTKGVVTLTLFGSDKLNGFFMQDTGKSNNGNASRGIFVYGNADVQQGDFVQLDAKVSEYRKRTQLSSVKNLQVLSHGMAVPYTMVKFPNDLYTPADYERYEGMALCIAHPMYLVSNNQVLSEASVELSSKRLRSPTDYHLPGKELYNRVLDSNRINRLTLDDGSNTRNPASNPWVDAAGTCRTGQKTDSLFFVLDQDNDRYKVYAVKRPVFYGNERTTAPNEAALGDYELKFCGFNLERYYDQEPLQRQRLVAALAAIDADMFGLVEVGGGKKVIDSLVAALNRTKGSQEYTYLSWRGYEATSDYTLNHIVYRPDKVEPYDNYFMLNNVGPSNRKLIQAFMDLKHKQKFIFSINHFKAKSGTGTGADADQGDGQGIFNNQRTKEAYAVVDRLNSLKFYYGTERIIVLGDLNAMYREDPIRAFTDAGYRNQTHRFGENYTYCFDGMVQYLDYSLASPAMEEVITGATVWHINSDEPSYLDYDRDNEKHNGPYRCSDHEPVIVGVKFKDGSNVACEAFAAAKNLNVYPNPAQDFVNLRTDKAGSLQIFSLGGQKLMEKKMNEGENTISVQSLAPGLYILRFIDASGVVNVGKLGIVSHF